MLTLLGYVTLAAVLFAGRAVLSAVMLHLAADRALRARKLDIEERTVAIQEQRTKSPAVPAAIPPDLLRRITRWGDPSAQESERKILLDLYQEFRDLPDPWVEVRAHLAPEPADDLPQEMFTGLLQS